MWWQDRASSLTFQSRMCACVLVMQSVEGRNCISSTTVTVQVSAAAEAKQMREASEQLREARDALHATLATKESALVALAAELEAVSAAKCDTQRRLSEATEAAAAQVAALEAEKASLAEQLASAQRAQSNVDAKLQHVRCHAFCHPELTTLSPHVRLDTVCASCDGFSCQQRVVDCCLRLLQCGSCLCRRCRSMM
jgi:septal ring factor EnvC (AmiA/AmiB activator)